MTKETKEQRLAAIWEKYQKALRELEDGLHYELRSLYGEIARECPHCGNPVKFVRAEGVTRSYAMAQCANFGECTWHKMLPSLSDIERKEPDETIFAPCPPLPADMATAVLPS